MTHILGILGGTGWLGQGLGLGLLRQDLWPQGHLMLLNRSGQAPAYAPWPGVRMARDIGDLQRSCSVIVLSVRPGDFPPQGFAPEGQLLISFMAGVTLAQLRALAPGARLVRAMPNGGAVSGTSWTPWLGEDLRPGDEDLVRRILSAMGEEARIESELQLDQLSALSGSGPAYPALLVEALYRKALAMGLPEGIAWPAVRSILTGAAPALQSGPAAAGEVLEAMHSYRGITSAGLSAAEAAGFGEAISAALDAAVAKAAEMARDKG